MESQNTHSSRTPIRYRRNLWQLFPDISKVVAVELGVAEGFFAADIAAWGVAKLYAVDLWESHPEIPGDAGNDQPWHNANYDAARKRLAPFGDKVVILRGPTTAMAAYIGEPLDFVNVDACHSYACVKADIEAYWPKLKKGGIMAFHDHEMKQYGVKQAVAEFAAVNRLTVNLLPEDKAEDAGAYLVKP